MIGTRRIYDEWTAESDPAHQKYIGLILRLSCGAAIPPKQRKWPKCSQSGADLRKSEQMGVSRTYTGTPGGRLYKVRWKGFAASRDSWEPPSSFVPRYTTVWMDYLKKKNISLDVKDVLVHLVAAVAP